MSNEVNKELNTNNKVVRFLLLILFPTLVVLTVTGYFYSLGRFISTENAYICLLYTSPSPRDISGSRMPSSA